MSGGDHYPIARNNLPCLESHYSAAFALFQYLGDDDSVHEYGTFRDLPIGEIRIALRHFVFMCDEKGYEVEFRGDVGKNYVECSELFLQQTEVMLDIPVCVHLSSSAAPGILWNSTILLCIHRIAFLHFLTAVMPRAGTTDCTKSFSLTGWRILRCLRSVIINKF